MIEERTAPIMDDLRDSYHDELIRLRSENKRQKDLLSLAVGKLETVINKASILKRERERERENIHTRVRGDPHVGRNCYALHKK